MPDSFYETDILAWSTQQADLLRRLSRGERVNDIDWAHVAQEIKDVGLSQLNAVRSYLRQMLVHLLKLHTSPDVPSANQSRHEIMAFQADAEQRFEPSMQQQIDVEALYSRAVRQLQPIDPETAYPATCPITLPELLQADMRTLEGCFRTRPLQPRI